jgi:hypothetical protein
VHEFVPDRGTTKTWLFEEPISSANLTDAPEVLLLVCASRIALGSPQSHPDLGL